jgi:hypothetical protein
MARQIFKIDVRDFQNWLINEAPSPPWTGTTQYWRVLLHGCSTSGEDRQVHQLSSALLESPGLSDEGSPPAPSWMNWGHSDYVRAVLSPRKGLAVRHSVPTTLLVTQLQQLSLPRVPGL